VSKQWQVFFTFAFLAVAYVFTVVFCVRLLISDEADGGAKGIAALVLLAYLFLIPATLIGLGAGLGILRAIEAPFLTTAR